MTIAEARRGFVFRELFAQLRYLRSRSDEIVEYTTRGGVEVPFVVTLEGCTFGFTVDEEQHATEKSLKSLGKFKQKFSSTRPIAFHCGKDAYQSSSEIWCLPIEWLV